MVTLFTTITMSIPSSVKEFSKARASPSATASACRSEAPSGLAPVAVADKATARKPSVAVPSARRATTGDAQARSGAAPDLPPVRPAGASLAAKTSGARPTAEPHGQASATLTADRKATTAPTCRTGVPLTRSAPPPTGVPRGVDAAIAAVGVHPGHAPSLGGHGRSQVRPGPSASGRGAAHAVDVAIAHPAVATEPA